MSIMCPKFKQQRGNLKPQRVTYQSQEEEFPTYGSEPEPQILNTEEDPQSVRSDMLRFYYAQAGVILEETESLRTETLKTESIPFESSSS